MCYWYQSVFHHWQSIHKNSLGDEGFISAHGFKGFGLCSSHCIAFGPKVKRNIKIGSPWKKLDVPWHREEVKGNITLKDMPPVAPVPCFCTSQLLRNECHRPHSVLPQSPTLITVLGAQPLTHYLVWNVGNSNSNPILMNSTRGKTQSCVVPYLWMRVTLVSWHCAERWISDTGYCCLTCRWIYCSHTQSHD